LIANGPIQRQALAIVLLAQSHSAFGVPSDMKMRVRKSWLALERAIQERDSGFARFMLRLNIDLNVVARPPPCEEPLKFVGWTIHALERIAHSAIRVRPFKLNIHSVQPIIPETVRYVGHELLAKQCPALGSCNKLHMVQPC